MPDSEYKIKITTAGDPAGANAVANSLDKVDTAARGAAAGTKDQGKASGEAASLVDQFGKRGAAAHDVVEGLTRATQGGVGGLLGLAKAAVNAREALAISGFGLLLGVVLGLAPALLQMAQSMIGAGTAGEDAAEKIAGATKAGEQLAALKLDNLKTELDGIKDAAQFFDQFLAKLAEIQKRTSDARKAVELAEIDASDLDPEAKKAEKFLIEDRFARGDAAREAALRAERVAAADRLAADTSTVEQGAQKQLGAQRQTVEQVTRRLADRLATEAESKTALRESAFAEPGSASGIAASERYLAASRKLTGTASAESITAELVGAIETLNALAKGIEPLATAAEKARGEAGRIRATTSLEDTNAPLISGLTRRAARLAAGVPEPEERPRTDTTVSAAGRIEIGGADVTAKINRQIDQMRALGESAARLGNAIESSILINGKVISQIEKTAATLEEQIRATRR